MSSLSISTIGHDIHHQDTQVNEYLTKISNLVLDNKIPPRVPNLGNLSPLQHLVLPPINVKAENAISVKIQSANGKTNTDTTTYVYVR